MEKILRIALPIIIIALAYFLYESIAGPVREQKKIDALEAKIQDRLLLIKDAQFAYRDKNKKFAPNFDVLINSLKNEKMPLIKVTGDPEDTLSVVTYDTSYISLKEAAFDEQEVNLDSLPFVPGSKKETKFVMNADIINKNGVEVPVFEVYDPDPYNKKRALRVGSLSDAIYSGNWE